MRHYLCPDCFHVTRADGHAPFHWCTCGRTLDAVSLITDSVPLSKHPNVIRAERAGRFAQRGDRAPLATSGR